MVPLGDHPRTIRKALEPALERARRAPTVPVPCGRVTPHPSPVTRRADKLTAQLSTPLILSPLIILSYYIVIYMCGVSVTLRLHPDDEIRGVRKRFPCPQTVPGQLHMQPSTLDRTPEVTI